MATGKIAVQAAVVGVAIAGSVDVLPLLLR